MEGWPGLDPRGRSRILIGEGLEFMKCELHSLEEGCVCTILYSGGWNTTVI